MKKLLAALAAALVLTSACYSSDVKDHLVQVQHSAIHLTLPPQVQQIHGNGICINAVCSIVATAYHIQMLAGRANLTVGRVRTEKVLSRANESDANRSLIPSAEKKELFYNVANDVSFVYTTRGVPGKSGITYLYNSYVGQRVQVAGYYHNKFETKEATIIGLDVPLTVGNSYLKENLLLDILMKPGNSGNAVLDEQGNLLGMIILSGALKLDGSDLPASVALPVKTIARAITELDPIAGTAIFDKIPGEEGQSSAQAPQALYQENDLTEDTSPLMPVLSVNPIDVPNAVDELQAKARAASQMLVNVVGKECLILGAHDRSCYELSVVEGRQTFRQFDRGGKAGKPMTSFPAQKHGVWTLDDWAGTWDQISENPWLFQGIAGDYYLFAFKSSAADDRCYWEEYSHGTPLFGNHHQDWKGAVDCFEQILTDRDFNLLAVFTEMHPPDGCLTELVQTAIYYDWITLEKSASPILLPVMERVSAKVAGQKKLLYANVFWSDYRKFRADHSIDF